MSLFKTGKEEEEDDDDDNIVHLLQNEVGVGNKYQHRERQMLAVIVMKPLEMAWPCRIYYGFWM